MKHFFGPLLIFKYFNAFAILLELAGLIFSLQFFMEYKSIDAASYTFWFSLVGIMAAVVSLIAFKLAPSLQTMGNHKKRDKFFMYILLMQAMLAIINTIIEISIVVNSRLFRQSDNNKYASFAVFQGFNAFFLLENTLITYHYKKSLNLHFSHSSESTKGRINEMELYAEAAQHLYQEMSLEKNIPQQKQTRRKL